jgi:hypothetical protein
MSQLNETKRSIEPDNLYYDILITNSSSTNTKPKAFTYNESRALPFIKCPELYDLSVVRFTVDTGLTPVFIPSIEPNQANRDLTTYSVTLEYDNVVVERPIVWVPQDSSAEIPPSPSQTYNKHASLDTGYYNGYSYTYFCYLVYVALQEAHTELKAQLNALGNTDLVDSLYAPIISWDSTSNSAVIYANVNYFDVAETKHIALYMNAPLYSLFSSFPAKYLGYDGVTYGRNYRLTITDVGGTNSQTITVPRSYPDSWTAITLYQEYSTTEAWSPITSIVFCSNTLPIIPTQVSTPFIYDENNLQKLTGNDSATSNIITDIVSSSGLYRPNLVYAPQAEFRRISMLGNTPLTNIDIQIYYRLRTGHLIPFTLNSGGSVTLKLAFFKKNQF